MDHDNIDILDVNLDLAGVDTSMPRLEPGTYAMSIASVSIKPNKAGTGRNMQVEFATTSQANSTKGDTIHEGYKISKYYPLQQAENANAPNFKRDICILIDAVFGTTQETRPALNSETINSMKGKIVDVIVGVSTSDQYGESNEVKRIKSHAE